MRPPCPWKQNPDRLPRRATLTYDIDQVPHFELHWRMFERWGKDLVGQSTASTSLLT
jgi:hypothetical protein